MNLLSDLQNAGRLLSDVAPSHVPTVNELAGVVGALIAHLEHGEPFLKAVEQGGEAIAKALAPAAADVVESIDPGAAPIVKAVETVAPEVEHAAAEVASPSADLSAKLDAVLMALQGVAGQLGAIAQTRAVP